MTAENTYLGKVKILVTALVSAGLGPRARVVSILVDSILVAGFFIGLFSALATTGRALELLEEELLGVLLPRGGPVHYLEIFQLVTRMKHC